MQRLYKIILLSVFFLAGLAFQAQAQFKEGAFTQSYNDQTDTTAVSDTADKLFSIKELMGGLAHKNTMKIGTVTGSVWATRKATCLQGQTFLVVDLGDKLLVAADQVGAGKGDKVLLVLGSAASRFCMEAPVDAAVVAILDQEEK